MKWCGGHASLMQLHEATIRLTQRDREGDEGRGDGGRAKEEHETT